MKISNFRNVVKIPSKEHRAFYSLKADVDVTTSGILGWKKKTETRQVFRDECAINWIWADTGKWTPGHVVEELYKVYCIQEKINSVTNNQG